MKHREGDLDQPAEINTIYSAKVVKQIPYIDINCNKTILLLGGDDI